MALFHVPVTYEVGARVEMQKIPRSRWARVGDRVVAEFLLFGYKGKTERKLGTVEFIANGVVAHVRLDDGRVRLVWLDSLPVVREVREED